MRHRQRETESHRNGEMGYRETDRQRHTASERERWRQRERQKCRETDPERQTVERWSEKHREAYLERQVQAENHRQ